MVAGEVFQVIVAAGKADAFAAEFHDACVESGGWGDSFRFGHYVVAFGVLLEDVVALVVEEFCRLGEEEDVAVDQEDVTGAAEDDGVGEFLGVLVLAAGF